MAGLRMKCKQQFRGSSIMEVIIAMVAIVVVFGIAMMIYSNVLRLSLSLKKLKAERILDSLLIEMRTGREVTDELITVASDLKVEITVKPCRLNRSLKEVSIIAYDTNGEKLSQLRQILKPEYE